MKAEELDISAIQSINTFYEVLDLNALQLQKEHDILDIWLKYKNQTPLEEEKQKAQWEVECFCFSFHGNGLFAFATSNSTDAVEIKQYPDLSEFQSQAFEYLQARALSAKCSLLLARYNHLLWRGHPQKRKVYAISAIAHYIKAIHDYNLLVEQGDDSSAYQIGTLFENLVALSNEIKEEIEIVKELSHHLLFNSPKINFYTKHGLIDDMLKYPKLFKPNDFIKVPAIFEAHIQTNDEKLGDFGLINYHLPTAIKVSKKAGLDVKKWHNELGLASLRMAQRETDEERDWIKFNHYAKAIEAFRLAGNREKKKETEQLYFELKPKVKLTEYRVDFDEATIKKIQAFDEELKKKAKHLLKQPPQIIYSTIAMGGFFPRHADVLKASKNRNKEFFDFATTIYFDNNKNVSSKSPGKEEMEELLKAYAVRMTETLLPFLHYVFVLGIKSGHLTYRNFIEFLIQHSWIGAPHIKINLSGQPEETNWAKLVAPSIAEFFVQVQAWGESKYYRPSFILCIDSMALKIEGLFRSFCERLNVSTSIGKQKGIQEALLHNVLDNSIIRKYFNEDDTLLFDYVFSNGGGLNLRNNIAHAFYDEDDYHPNKMILLLAVLLRVGKYNVTKSS